MSELKYKIGDKVRIKSIDWYNENKDEYGNIELSTHFFISEMSQLCGKVVTIKDVFEDMDDNVVYYMEEMGFDWTDEMIEGLAIQVDNIPNTIQVQTSSACSHNGFYGYSDSDGNEISEWYLPEGYIFKDENGNVINATKIVLGKKKKEYPKTYEECCKVLGCKADDFFTDFSYNNGDVEISDYEDKIDDLLQNFRKLRYCRDAYWKIAGDEMRLGKPWEPDYTDHDQDRYAIVNFMGNIEKSKWDYGYSITFVFPTEEMCDAFYENFKEEIEICKELL